MKLLRSSIPVTIFLLFFLLLFTENYQAKDKSLKIYIVYNTNNECQGCLIGVSSVFSKIAKLPIDKRNKVFIVSNKSLSIFNQINEDLSLTLEDNFILINNQALYDKFKKSFGEGLNYDETLIIVKKNDKIVFSNSVINIIKEMHIAKEFNALFKLDQTH